MPELPEVESVKRGLAHELRTPRKIESVRLLRKDLRFPFPKNLAGTLAGHNLIGFSRRGKYLLFDFDHGTLLSHLGMSGSWRTERDPVELRTHDHIVLRAAAAGHSPSVNLVYNDPRRFGFVDWISKEKELGQNRFLKKLGPEPFDPTFTGESLKRAARKRSAPIKNFIMDASQVVGVGNIYASEALFRAGVRPGRAAKSLTLDECNALVEAIRTVLKEAIDSGGSTIRDYRGASGESGGFQHLHRVYGRAGEECLVCGPAHKTKIKKTTMAARATYYCPRCQN